MTRTYQIISGDRPVAVSEAHTASAALLDYVHSLGCRDADLMRLAPDTLSWRGAVFKAVPMPAEEPSGT